MASHFLFEPEFCNPAAGWEKGQIEKNVQDARRRLWQHAPAFKSLDELERRDAAARTRFFELLKAGGSDDPDVLLKRAGFDPGSPAAYKPMVQRMERLVRQLEAVTSRP